MSNGCKGNDFMFLLFVWGWDCNLSLEFVIFSRGKEGERQKKKSRNFFFWVCEAHGSAMIFSHSKSKTNWKPFFNFFWVCEAHRSAMIFSHRKSKTNRKPSQISSLFFALANRKPQLPHRSSISVKLKWKRKVKVKSWYDV